MYAGLEGVESHKIGFKNNIDFTFLLTFTLAKINSVSIGVSISRRLNSSSGVIAYKPGVIAYTQGQEALRMRARMPGALDRGVNDESCK